MMQCRKEVQLLNNKDNTLVEFMGGEDVHTFSFFRKPIQNTVPHQAIAIPDIYRYIVGPYAKKQTLQLRQIKDKDAARKFKAMNFDYCTFSGLFSTRSKKDLLLHSGMLCIDFDHVADLDSLKARLLEDPYFDTELLFTSPSGDGVKWVIDINLSGYSHSDFFACVANYLVKSGYPPPDESGSDVSRSCFIPYDPNAYINTKYGIHAKENFFTPEMGPCPF